MLQFKEGKDEIQSR